MQKLICLSLRLGLFLLAVGAFPVHSSPLKNGAPIISALDSASHPRLWLTAADLPRLRRWATDANPLYRDGIKILAERAKSEMDLGHVPNEDCGSTEYETYPTEMYAQLFAFMSLIENDSALRSNYAARARTLLMTAINFASQGPASEQNYTCAASGSTGYPPFRSPKFFTENSNRARWHGEAFPLVVDWIYPILSAQDKQTIRSVFLRWSQEIIERGYQHPSPVGLVNDPSLLSDISQVRWSGNNYFTAHMRNLGMMSLTLDAVDDQNNQLRNYLGNATGAWLYLFDHLTRHDSQGGLLPEGFEYSPQTASYAIQFLLALRTAGADTCGPHCQFQGNPFWDDLLSSFYHSLSPATINDPDYGPQYTLYEPAWYGDAQTYRSIDYISAFGALGVYDQLSNNSTRLQSLRWAEINTAPGGASTFLNRISNTDEFRNSLLYFMLYDPTLPAASDPRPNLALDYFAPGLNKLLSRTGWDSGASWFNFSLSWNAIDHQQADGNSFEWYRQGEWLTKARTGYPDVAEGIASSEFRNTLALENDKPDRSASDWRIDLWQRGSQWNLVAVGDPQLLAHSANPTYTYALGDATNLYNSTREASSDIIHASRSIVWLKPDAVIVFDRGQSGKSNRFKRGWLQLANPASVSGNQATSTTPGGQLLTVTSLLPSGATLSADNALVQHIEDTASRNDPMKVRLRIDAPGNPEKVNFLEVLQAGSAASVTLIQSSDQAWSGAQIGATAVLFPVTLGRPLTSFSYTTAFSSTPVRQHLITGLQPNTAYNAHLSGLTLTLAQGGSQMSDSGGVFFYRSTDLPGTPSLTSITAGPGSATLVFTPAPPDNGLPISRYTATCTADGQATRTANGSQSPIRVNGLTGNVLYNCWLTATNEGGLVSTSSAALSVTPTPGKKNSMTPMLMLLLD
jgi:hypothetical protein